MHFRVQLLSVVAARLGVSVGRAIAGAADPRLDASVGRVIAGAMASAGQRPMVVRPSELTQPGRLDGAKRLLGRLVEVEHVPNARFGCCLVCGQTARDVGASSFTVAQLRPGGALTQPAHVVQGRCPSCTCLRKRVAGSDSDFEVDLGESLHLQSDARLYKIQARSNATLLVYIDNFEIISGDVDEIHRATSLALRFFEAWAFRIDRDKSWSWTTAMHRHAQTFELHAAKLNLGRFQRYRKSTRHGNLAARLKEGAKRAQCIAALPFDTKARLQAILAGPLQVALYGSEISYIGEKSVKGLRSGLLQSWYQP